MFDFLVMTYILQNGIDNIKTYTDEDIKKMKEESKEYEESLKGTNKIPIMTTEFKVAIVERAREICLKEQDETIDWIKKELKNFKYRK